MLQAENASKPRRPFGIYTLRHIVLETQFRGQILGFSAFGTSEACQEEGPWFGLGRQVIATRAKMAAVRLGPAQVRFHQTSEATQPNYC